MGGNIYEDGGNIYIYIYIKMGENIYIKMGGKYI